MPKRFRLILAIAIAAILGFFGYEPAKLVMGLKRKGFLDAPEQRTYEASTRKNLLAIHTALGFAHDSDGSYPAASSWMDEAAKRIKSSDMSTEEAEKKLVDPALEGQPGKFGYAINVACAGKFKGDLKPETVLVFMSQDTRKNAVGDPAKDAPNPPRQGGNWGITVSGSVVKL